MFQQVKRPRIDPSIDSPIESLNLFGSSVSSGTLSEVSSCVPERKIRRINLFGAPVSQPNLSESYPYVPNFLQLTEDEKEFQAILREREVPFVGLINKITGQIIVGACIAKKVNFVASSYCSSKLDSIQILDAKLNALKEISELEELKKYQGFFEQGYLPRMFTIPGAFKSAHELLFEKRGLVNKADWGGFAVTLSASNEVSFAFASGSFNTRPGEERQKGALLEVPLLNQVQSRIENWLKRKIIPYSASAAQASRE